jgi:hypothetical protein
MCEKCVDMIEKKASYYCNDCRNDISVWGIAEWFMVSDAVWKESKSRADEDLCVGCLEKRLGRKLVPNDFGGENGFFPVNNLYEHSPRLRNRLGKDRERDTVDGMVSKLLLGSLMRDLLGERVGDRAADEQIGALRDFFKGKSYGSPRDDFDHFDNGVQQC